MKYLAGFRQAGVAARRWLNTTSTLGGRSGPGVFARAADEIEDTAPQFIVGFENGFLPRQEPMRSLPPEFHPLQNLLSRMRIQQPDGTPGLLATGDFGKAVESELPEFDVSDIQDSHLLTALYRDYSFASSAYLLEPCHISKKRTGEYGIGKDVLPANLARPFAQLANKLNCKPFLEYSSYCLFNWRKKDASGGMPYDNLECIRMFHGMESEKGFMLVHVAMVQYSPKQVEQTVRALESCQADNRVSFDESLGALIHTFSSINASMEAMWRVSIPAEYGEYRTFIMGTKNQPMFPEGVVYEGVSSEPVFLRGETGANDSMIPTIDNLLQLTQRMPTNPLTEILKDFRSYRPKEHNSWLQWVEQTANTVGVREYALKDNTSAVLYLGLLDQIRDFRHRHWNFTKEYIIKHTNHPVATGGSPIVTWLPNQLSAVLDAMLEAMNYIQSDRLDATQRVLVQEYCARADTQRKVLDKEVEALRKRFPGQA